MADTRAPSPEEMEAVATKLAEFRNTLPEREQAMMDTLVAMATGQAEQGEGGADSPPESEVANFAKKLENYRDTLPEDERPLVDGMVIASGAVDEEVTGYLWVGWIQAWTTIGPSSQYSAYSAACHNRPGDQRLDSQRADLFGGFRLYRCYDYKILGF